MTTKTRPELMSLLRAAQCRSLSIALLLSLLIAAMPRIAFAAEANTATRAVLVGPDLQPRTVTIQGMGNGVVSFFDDEGAYQTRKMADFLVMGVVRDLTKRPLRRQEGMLELTDGQRIRGKWAGASDDGSMIKWSHASMGEATVSLEQLSLLHFAASGDSVPADRTADVVVLANGDRVRGFIEQVDAKSLAIEADQTGAVMRFGLDRVSSIFLAAVPNDQPTDTHMVHLADGSRVLARSLALRDGKLLIDTPLFARDGDEASSEGQSVDLDEVVRIVFASRAGRLVALEDLPRAVTAGGEVFGRKRPPHVDERGLILHAPVTLKVQLPRGATRFTALATVGTPRNESGDLRAWTDFTLTIYADDKPVATHRMNASDHTVRVNTPVNAKHLTFELDAAINGPVGDVLLLTDAQVLIENPER